MKKTQYLWFPPRLLVYRQPRFQKTFFQPVRWKLRPFQLGLLNRQRLNESRKGFVFDLFRGLRLAIRRMRLWIT
jgi:hypothetical protein